MPTIQLYGRKAAGRVALVDDEDYELVMQYRWHAVQSTRKSGSAGLYASTAAHRPGARQRHVFMHNLIMGTTWVDHVNHDTLDNRRGNLRVATNSENMGNMRVRRGGTSQYKGVHWNSRAERWEAGIKRDGKSRYLGRFTDEAQAARAYDDAAREVWGPFACLNFPGPGESSALTRDLPGTAAAVPDPVPAPLGWGASPYVGVVWEKYAWLAHAFPNRKLIRLGYYASQIEAALAYDAAAPGIYGDAARLNFPDGLTPELAAEMLAQQETGKAEAEVRRQAGIAARVEWWKNRQPVTRICEGCGDKYQSTATSSKFCSNPCGQRAWRRARSTASRLGKTTHYGKNTTISSQALPGVGRPEQAGERYRVGCRYGQGLRDRAERYRPGCGRDTGGGLPDGPADREARRGRGLDPDGKAQHPRDDSRGGP